MLFNKISLVIPYLHAIFILLKAIKVLECVSASCQQNVKHELKVKTNDENSYLNASYLEHYTFFIKFWTTSAKPSDETTLL